MDNIHFVWNTSKAQTNSSKHGVTFEEAVSVFDDENGRLIFDPEHSESEERFILMGISHTIRVLIVVHGYRDSENEIRIISARKATKRETTQYRGYLK